MQSGRKRKTAIRNVTRAAIALIALVLCDLLYTMSWMRCDVDREEAYMILFDSLKRISYFLFGIGCQSWTGKCYHWGKAGRDTPGCCRAKLLELAERTSAALSQQNITHWMTQGTLLGAVRHGDMIPWDQDVDFDLLTVDSPDWRARLLRAKEKLRADHGYHYSDSILGLQYSDTNSNSIDFYPVRAHLGWRLPWPVSEKDSKDTLRDDERARELQRWHAQPVRSNPETQYLSSGGAEGASNVPLPSVLPVRSCQFAHIALPCPRDPVAYAAALFRSQRWQLLTIEHKYKMHGGCQLRDTAHDQQLALESTQRLGKLGYPSLQPHIKQWKLLRHREPEAWHDVGVREPPFVIDHLPTKVRQIILRRHVADANGSK